MNEGVFDYIAQQIDRIVGLLGLVFDFSNTVVSQGGRETRVFSEAEFSTLIAQNIASPADTWVR